MHSMECVEGELVYCCDIPGLLHHLGGAYEPDDWRLGIDSSKKEFKVSATNNRHKISLVSVRRPLRNLTRTNGFRKN